MLLAQAPERLQSAYSGLDWSTSAALMRCEQASRILSAGLRQRGLRTRSPVPEPSIDTTQISPHAQYGCRRDSHCADADSILPHDVSCSPPDGEAADAIALSTKEM